MDNNLDMSKADRPPSDSAPPGRHSVRVVSRQTGLTPDTLRAWERRHSTVVPARSEGRQRLYTEAEVERLKLLGDLVRGGRRIKDIASLGVDELKTLLRSDARSMPAKAPEVGARGASLSVDACLRAISELDGDRLDALLARAASQLGAAAFVETLVVHLLREIGLRWQHGALSAAHEHLATVSIRSQLIQVLARQQSPGGARLVLVTTPERERHELGALCVAVSAATLGWRSVFLGASIPAADIAAAARQLGADVVALSLVRPEAGADMASEVRQLVGALPGHVVTLIGGSGALELRDDIEKTGARWLEDLSALRSELTGVARARG